MPIQISTWVIPFLLSLAVFFLFIFRTRGTFLFLLISILALVFFLASQSRWHRERTQALAPIALEMGFAFEPRGRTATDYGLPHVFLFQQERGRLWSLQNVIRGSFNGVEVMVFDYPYSLGRRNPIYRQTIAAFHFTNQHPLPLFLLRPRQLVKLEPWRWRSGYSEVSFEDHPEFSQNYQLMAQDKEAIRILFTTDCLTAFSRNPGWFVEGGRNWLMVYRINELTKPSTIRDFLEATVRVHGLFLKQQA